MNVNSPSHSPFLSPDTERSDGESFRTAHGSMRADGESQRHGSFRSDGESFRTTHGSFRSGVGGTEGASTSTVNVVTGVEDPANSPNAHALREKLTRFFEPHVTEQNREAFTQLIEQRATRLNEMGETPEGVEATLAKGQWLDRVSQGVAGAVKSVPFGAASRLLDTVPALTAFASGPAMIGFVAGTISGVADTVGGGVLKRATSDIHWLSAKPEELDPVMADAAKAREPSPLRSTLEASANLQTFTLRNALRTGVAAAMTTDVPDKKATETPAETADRTAKEKHNANARDTDSKISASGSVAAGGASALIQQGINEHYHRTGPEYLLGRQDWEAQYTALKEVNPLKDPLINGGKRLAQIPVDMMTDGLEATRNFFTATSLVQNVGMLGGGFAAVEALKDVAGKSMEKAGFGEPAVATTKQAINTVAAAPVFAGWAGASIMTGSAADKAVNYLQENTSSLLNQAATYLHGRPSGSQPIPADDTALENMEEGRPQQNTTGNDQPVVAAHDQEHPEIVTEQPPTTTAAGAPSTSASGQGEVAMVQVESTPLNAAERNV